MASFFSNVLSALQLNQLRNECALARGQHIRICAIELEPRVLYSATPFDVGGPSDHDSAALLGDTHPDDLMLEAPESGSGLSAELLSAQRYSLPELASESTDELHRLIPEKSSFGHEIVFIDSGVKGWQLMLQDLKSASDSQTNLSIVLLDSHRDGIEQISQSLSNLRNLTAIHLISHGDAGQLQLGNTSLASQNISAYAAEISNWHDSLADGADLLIYSCNLASSEEGRFLAESLGELCNCDVAASDDLTGQALLRGDWDLEYVIGENSSTVVFSEAFQQNWMGRLATYTVNSTADNSSAGTLRWAIQQANSNAGADTIDFAISDADSGHLYYRDDGIAGSLSSIATTSLGDASIFDFDPDYPTAGHSWFQIDLDNSRPQLSITDTVIIDGYSQAGAFQNTQAIGHDAILRIELTNSAPDGKRGLTFGTGANGSTLMGLAINDFDGIGVLVDYDVHDVTIQGNFVGTDITGTVDIGNGDSGIQLRSNGNLVGGPNDADRNVISGNDNRGIALFTTGTLTGNIIQNNYIGVDAAGINALANKAQGIQLWNDDGTRVIDNVISGNETDGILFRAGSQTHNAIIQGNMIGVGADGTTPIGNGSDGILVESDSATSNQFGGSGAGEGNIISGNASHGINFSGAGVSGNFVFGNKVGTDASASLNLGNGRAGVQIVAGSYKQIIGGLNPGEANVIAFNNHDGVAVHNGTSNRVRGNVFTANGDLAIDLIGHNGPNNNDHNDGDGGPNNLQNFPVISAAEVSGFDIKIDATLNSNPSTNGIIIDFYWSSSGDLSGHGEAEQYVGSVTVNTDALGNASISPTFLNANVPVGAIVTATATDNLDNTSEFSLNFTTTQGNTAPILNNNQLALGEGDTISLSAANLSATDSTEPDSSLIFNISGIVGGHFALSTDTMMPITSFSQAQVTAGEIVFVDNGDENAPAYSVTVTDGTLNNGPHPATIIFTNINDDPTVSAAVTAIATEDDASFAVDLISSSRDPESDPLNVSALTLVSGDDSGITNGVNSLSVDPNAYNFLAVGESEIITYNYNIIDGNGGSIAQTTTITITGLNDAPVITSDGGGATASINMAENTISVTTITASDLDLPANTLTYSITGGADQTQFAIDPSSGVLTFISPNDFEAPTDADINNKYEVVITVADGKGGTDVQSITVTVLDVNEAPTTTGIPDLTFDEDSLDSMVDLHSAFDDPENADTDLVYTVESVSNPGLFDSVTINGADEIVLDFAANQNGSTLITVRATDTGGQFVETTVRVDVDSINDDPVISSSGLPIVVNEGASGSILDLDLVFADVDILTNGDILTYLIVSNSNTALVDAALAGSNLILDYQDDQFGASTIAVRATDSFGQSVDETLSITVNPINDAPTVDFPISLVAVVEDDPVSIFDLSSVFGDIDDSALTYTVNSNTNPTLVDAAISGNLLTLVYLPNQFGIANIVVRATDAAGDSIDHAIDVTVIPANDVPVLGNNILSINEGQSVTLSASDLSATDIESANPNLTFTVSQVSGGQFELSTAPGAAIMTFTQGQVTSGQVVFIDDGDEFAPSCEIVVDDGLNTDGPWPANITFANVNDSPVGSSDLFTSLVGDNLLGSGLLSNDSDSDNSFLTAILDSSPSHGSLTLNLDGSFVYKPDPGFDGVDSFSYLVHDGTTNSDPTTVVITVLNAGPMITPPNVGPPRGGDSDDEDLEDILLPTNISSDLLKGAGANKGKSIPIAKISFDGTATEIESVFRVNVTNAQVDDSTFYWNEVLTRNSTEVETINKNPRTTSKDLLDKAGWFWQALDQNSRQLQFEGNLPEFLLGSSAAMASTVTVGYLMWLVKGGQIMAAVMANLPAWRLIDPLPILNAILDDDEDEDSLQSIIEQGEVELQSDSQRQTPPTK